MKIIHENDPTLPIVKLKFIFKNSGRLADSTPGTASMLARLLNEGTNESFFKDLEQRAIELRAHCEFANFIISIKCLKEHMSFALKKLLKLLNSPRYEESLLKKLKITALGELLSLENENDYLAKRLLDKNIFKNKAFDSAIDGDAASIKAISLANLKAAFKENLVKSRLHIQVGGDIKEEEFASFDPIIACFEKGEIKEPSFKLHNFKEELKKYKKSEQAYIYFASPFFIKLDDENAYLAKIALFVLGAGGFGSRVMEEIRVKRGLAYSAYASLELKPFYTRVFGLLQTKNENASKAKSLIRQIFKDFVLKGVSEEELELAKRFLVLSAPLKYESLDARLSIASLEYINKLKKGFYKEELKKIEKTTIKNINSFIKKHEELTILSFASIENKK